MRFTVRMMMVVVAAVALGLGGYKLHLRSKEFRALAVEYDGEAKSYLSHAELWDKGLSGGCMEPGMDEAGRVDYARGARMARLNATCYSHLSRKYAHAAAHPWLSVVPDPKRPW